MLRAAAASAAGRAVDVARRRRRSVAAARGVRRARAREPRAAVVPAGPAVRGGRARARRRRRAAVRDARARLAAGGARARSRPSTTEIHVHAAFDMHDLGDLALAAGLAEPVLDVDRIEVTYADVAAPRARSAGRAAASTSAARPAPGADGPAALGPASSSALPRGADGRFAVTVELILGQAWGRGGPLAAKPGGRERSSVVPIERIGRTPFGKCVSGRRSGARFLAGAGCSARIRAARRRQAAASHRIIAGRMTIRTRVFAPVLALLALSIAGPAWSDFELNMPVGVTTTSREVYELHMLILVGLRRHRRRRLRGHDRRRSSSSGSRRARCPPSSRTTPRSRSSGP